MRPYSSATANGSTISAPNRLRAGTMPATRFGFPQTEATWSRPRIMAARDEPLHVSQPCSAVLTRDNVLVLACNGDGGHRDERVLVGRADGDRPEVRSGDARSQASPGDEGKECGATLGRNWRVGLGDMRSACGGRYVIHPALLQRTDGSLMAFLRGPTPMPAVLSGDLGETWRESHTVFPGIGGGQKAAVLRLASGKVLFCSINNQGKVVEGGGTFAALSADDGRTWAHVRKVPGVGGYMSLTQSANGVVYLFGTQMTCVAFNERWLTEAEPFPAPTVMGSRSTLAQTVFRRFPVNFGIEAYGPMPLAGVDRMSAHYCHPTTTAGPHAACPRGARVFRPSFMETCVPRGQARHGAFAPLRQSRYLGPRKE